MADSGLSRLPVAGQIGLSVGLAAVILGLFYYFQMDPMMAEEKQKTKQLSGLENEILQLENTAAKLPEFQREVALLEQSLEKLKRVLPPQKETDDLIRKIHSLATESSLKIRTFDPQSTRTMEFYIEYPIKLEVEGTYHNLAMFFDRVSRLTRLVNAETLGIKAATNQTQFVTISASCIAKTFVYQETPPPPPGGAARGARAGVRRPGAVQ